MSGASPYAGTTPVASLAQTQGYVTLVESQTFMLSGRSGDVVPSLPHGLFVLDTRVLSRWELRINGQSPEPLSVQAAQPFSAVFASHGAPGEGRADADLVVFRHRDIGRGMTERIVLTNHGMDPVDVLVELYCDVDFADVFEVKDSRVQRHGEHRQSVDGRSLRFGHLHDEHTRSVAIESSVAGTVGPGLMTWQVSLPPREAWEVCLDVTVAADGEPLEPRFRCGQPDTEAEPSRRLAAWRATIPRIRSDNALLEAALSRSGEDLGALRIFDPEHPEQPILAAGAPWFMTVFGRDSLLTAWMTLIADSSLADGVLTTLARFQGVRTDAETEEEPGKILHEMRFGSSRGPALGGGSVYYGSIDSTPLFVMLLGELNRWDPHDQLVQRLLPHADRAIEWIEQHGDRDGDGYVEYERLNPTGLANQGWKDSWDAVRFRDGALAQGPIALCEVQAYVYAAYVARAHLAAEAGDTATHDRCVERARVLRDRFNTDFWLEDQQCFALALDGDKQPVDAIASNMGHCLWAGIVEPDRAKLVAQQLLSPGMFSGFGIRTLDQSMRAYNPLSYHNGSVWPHDNAICAAGLARYGMMEEANRVIMAQLGVAEAFQGRLPELFAGFGRDTMSAPASYPTSCSPQAWAAASPLMWLRTILQLRPWSTKDEVWLAPELPEGVNRLSVEGIRMGHRTLSVHVEGTDVRVEGQGDLTVVTSRGPATSPLLE